MLKRCGYSGVLKRRFESADGLTVRWQVVLPTLLREEFLGLAHGGMTGGHFGRRRSAAAVQARAYWPSWSSDLDSFIRRCERCATYHRGVVPRRVKLKPLADIPLLPTPLAQLQVAQLQEETTGGQQRDGSVPVQSVEVRQHRRDEPPSVSDDQRQRDGPASSHGGGQQRDGSVPVQSVEVRQRQRDEPSSVSGDQRQRDGPASSHGGGQQRDGSVPVQSVGVRQHLRDEPPSVSDRQRQTDVAASSYGGQQRDELEAVSAVEDRHHRDVGPASSHGGAKQRDRPSLSVVVSQRQRGESPSVGDRQQPRSGPLSVGVERQHRILPPGARIVRRESAGGGSRALLGERSQDRPAGGYRRRHSPDRRTTGGGHRDERKRTRSRSPEGNLRGDNRGRVEDRRHQVNLSSSEYEAFQKFLGLRCH